MNRRIITGLDETGYTKSAVAVAFRRARLYDGEVVGVAAIDRVQIERGAGPVPIGGIEISRRRVDRLIGEATERARRLGEWFLEQGAAAGVRCRVVTRDGVPWEVIIQESRAADLIVTGIRTSYRIGAKTDAGETVRRMLQAGSCPVLAVTEQTTLPENILIAYDGSLHASTALREFVHLNSLAVGVFRRVILLNIADDLASGMLTLKSAESYLKLYGISAEITVNNGNPTTVITKTAEKLEDVLIVMGANGRGRLADVFLGSTVKAVMAHALSPMFLCH